VAGKTLESALIEKSVPFPFAHARDFGQTPDDLAIEAPAALV
jgi:hypothetical protein